MKYRPNKNKIYVMIGISGSGKSTVANTLAKSLPNAILISRDKLREMVFGFSEAEIGVEYYIKRKMDLAKNEAYISKLSDTLMREALEGGKDVILDNTHLKLKYLNAIKDKYSNYEIEYIPVEVDLVTAIERDKKRTRTVGEDVIKLQYEDFKKLKKNFDFVTHKPTNKALWDLKYDSNKKDAYIFDVDGTLAEMNDRDAFDWDKVFNDTLHEHVADVARALKECGFTIIICTGRDGVCEYETKEWLKHHKIPFDEFYIREAGSYAKDWKVKEAMWKEIIKTYNIMGMFDDRNQVVNHARALGFNVFQVNYGNF